jgi:hypothetical protein
MWKAQKNLLHAKQYQHMSSNLTTTSISTSQIEEIFGTVDVTIEDLVENQHVDIMDYKFGRGRVDPAEINVQGHAYMVGTFDKYPGAKTVTVHFITPRLDEVTKFTFKREDLEWHRLRLSVIVDRATAETLDLNPRTEACKYCRKRVECPALRDQLLPIAKKHDGNNFAIDLLKKYSPDLVDDPEILGKMMEVAPVMESWSTAVKKRALQIAVETGEEIPGYEVRFRNPTSKIDDAQTAYEVLSDKLDPEEFMEACTVTVAKLAKVLANKKPRGEKKNARPELELALIQGNILPEEDEVEKTPYLKKKS